MAAHDKRSVHTGAGSGNLCSPIELRVLCALTYLAAPQIELAPMRRVLSAIAHGAEHSIYAFKWSRILMEADTCAGGGAINLWSPIVFRILLLSREAAPSIEQEPVFC